MKNNAKKMFRFGDIANLVYLIVFGIFIPLGILLMILGYIPDPDKQQLIDSGRDMLSWGIYMVVFNIIARCLNPNAKKELDDENNVKNVSPFIVTIVFGVLSQNPFYVLAGIFGLIEESKQGNQPAEEEPKMIEEPKEEPAKEE